MFDYYFFIDLLTWAALFSMTCLVYENSRFDKKIKQRFYLTYVVIGLAVFAEWIGLALNGAPGSTIELHKAAKCLDYIFTPMCGVFLIAQVSKRDKILKLMGFTMLVNIVFQVLSIFTGWGFYIDSENIYHHGPGYWFYMVIYLLTVLGVILEFYNYGKRYRKQNRISLLVIACFLVLGISVQETLGYRISYLCITIAAVFLFVHYSEFTQMTSDDNLKYQRELLEKDPLTGIFSRYAYTEELKTFNEKEQLPDGLIAFSIDVNELKRVNDSLGHLAGDEIIKGAAHCIRDVFSNYGKCYRTGGDEFICLIYGDEKLAGELKLRLEEAAATWKGQLVETMTLSVGYAIADDNRDVGIEKLISIADKCMYEAKAQFYMQFHRDRRRRRRED